MSFLGTIKSAGAIAPDPFFPPALADSREPDRAPTLYETYTTWRTCAKRATNKSVMGFNDPSMFDCWDRFKIEFAACALRREEAIQKASAIRRFEVDTSSTPWEPRPEYIELLRNTHRLPAADAPQ